MSFLPRRRLIAGLAFTASSAFAAGPKSEKQPIVVVEKVAARELTDVLTYPAKTSSKVRAIVVSPVDGIVVALDSEIGRRVAQGTSVMRIKNDALGYEYVPVAVPSPIKGVVASFAVTLGARVAQGQALATITDPTNSSILVEVPGSDISKIRSGMTGELTIGSADKPIAVRVTGVSPLVDEVTQTATVELKAQDSSPSIPLGIIGRVRFKTNERKAVELDDQAIVYRGAKTFVRLVQEGKAKFVPVTIAQTRNGRSEISQGLKEGDSVILRSSVFVDEGQTVVVQEADVAKGQDAGGAKQ